MAVRYTWVHVTLALKLFRCILDIFEEKMKRNWFKALVRILLILLNILMLNKLCIGIEYCLYLAVYRIIFLFSHWGRGKMDYEFSGCDSSKNNMNRWLGNELWIELGTTNGMIHLWFYPKWFRYWIISSLYGGSTTTTITESI